MFVTQDPREINLVATSLTLLSWNKDPKARLCGNSWRNAVRTVCYLFTLALLSNPHQAMAANRPISLSIKNADRSDAKILGPYCQSLRQSLMANWRHNSEPSDIKTVVHFMINSNGEMSHVELAESSGDSSFDSAATRAVQQSNPHSPLPRFNKSVLVVNATFNSMLLPRVAKSKYQNRSHAEDLAYRMGNTNKAIDYTPARSQEHDWIEDEQTSVPVQRASISRRSAEQFTNSYEAPENTNDHGRSSQSVETNGEERTRYQADSQPSHSSEKAGGGELKFIAPERLQYCTEDQIQRYLAQLHEFLQRPVTLRMR
ncbi:TonB C-terminal domain-containing protein [bacterium]|nr:TonB C-terminal domain-containing protein [bacterium]MBP9806830.1 TonB C-terminal domain-containing protein [bacterium]